jgi:Flp pilus assembly pilin Flp
MVWWHTRTSDERGASLVEYVFLLMLIALIAFAAIEFLGQEVDGDFDSFNSAHDRAG